MFHHLIESMPSVICIACASSRLKPWRRTGIARVAVASPFSFMIPPSLVSAVLAVSHNLEGMANPPEPFTLAYFLLKHFESGGIELDLPSAS